MTRPALSTDDSDVTQVPGPRLPRWVDGVAVPSAMLRSVQWGEAPDDIIELDETPLPRPPRPSTAPPPVPTRPKMSTALPGEGRRPAQRSGQPPALPPSRGSAAVSGQPPALPPRVSGALPPKPPPKVSGQQPPARKSGAQAAAASQEREDDLLDLMNEVIAETDSKRKAPQVQEPQVRRTSEQWWAEIFDESYYLTLPVGAYRRTLREVGFITASLDLPEGARILDLACGFGRHTLELAGRGYAMTGVDLSIPLLEKGLTESQRRDVEVEFLHGDMRDIGFNAEFDGVICMHSSFGYFDDGTNYAVLRNMAQALKPGGRLLIEVANRDFVAGNVPRRIWWEGDNVLFMEELDFLADISRMVLSRTVVVETEQPWEQRIDIRLYSVHELVNQLATLGMRTVEVSGDIAYRGSYLGANSRHIFILAERIQ